MKETKGIWVGAVALVVIAALGLWWISASQPIDSSTGGTEVGTGANSTSTGTGSGSGSTVTRVNRTSTDIVSIVAGLEGASQFNSYFKSTGVAASIATTGKYTIFVPTNGAFAQLPAGTIASMSAAEKKRMMQYHVVPNRVIDVDALVAGTIESQSRDMLNFSYAANKIPMVNSAIIIAEYKGKNGTVYLVDNVLLPPKKSGI